MLGITCARLSLVVYVVSAHLYSRTHASPRHNSPELNCELLCELGQNLRECACFKRLYRWGKRSTFGGTLPMASAELSDMMSNKKQGGGESEDDDVRHIFRWGKRSEGSPDEDTDFSHVFRWGKRLRDEEELAREAEVAAGGDSGYNRIFRWGKRSQQEAAYPRWRRLIRKRQSDEEIASDLRALFRWGKRRPMGQVRGAPGTGSGKRKQDQDEVKHVFRWGKRDTQQAAILAEKMRSESIHEPAATDVGGGD